MAAQLPLRPGILVGGGVMVYRRVPTVGVYAYTISGPSKYHLKQVISDSGLEESVTLKLYRLGKACRAVGCQLFYHGLPCPVRCRRTSSLLSVFAVTLTIVCVPLP